jgi:hypothetical protein
MVQSMHELYFYCVQTNRNLMFDEVFEYQNHLAAREK